MDLAHLAEVVQRWEADGTLHVGEAVVHGHHEPTPVAGAWGIGAGDDGSTTVARWRAGTWHVDRRYPPVEADAAAGHVFDQLGDVVAERHWGPAWWAQHRARVERGARLRTAAMLLWPEADLRVDRWRLAARLRELGIEPEGAWWISDVEGLPAPGELVPELHRRPDGFEVGVSERGAWTSWVRTTSEAEACRALFRAVVVSGSAVDMGPGDEPPRATDAYRPQLRAALEQVLGELDPPVA